MDRRMFVINIIKAIADAIIAALGILAFMYGANIFQRWWILLFMILPLAWYYSAHIVVLGEPVEDESDG